MKDQIQHIKDQSKDENDNGYGEMEIKRLQYHLARNIKPVPEWVKTGYENQDLILFTALIFLPMLVVILISDIVSGETPSGTIKLLLVRPISRTKILLEKWLAGNDGNGGIIFKLSSRIMDVELLFVRCPRGHGASFSQHKIYV